MQAKRKEGKESKGDKKYDWLSFCDRFVLPHMSHIFRISAVEKAGVFGDIIAPCGQAK